MLGHIYASEVDPNFKLTSNPRRSLSSTSQLAHLNYELLHHFYTFREREAVNSTFLIFRKTKERRNF